MNKVSKTKQDNLDKPYEVTDNDKRYAPFMHLAPLAMFIIPLPIIVNLLLPVLLWLFQRDESPFIDEQGRQVVNFQLSMSIYTAISGLLIPALLGSAALGYNVPWWLGFALLPVCGLLWFFSIIRGASKSAQGINYSYPLAIPFISANQSRRALQVKADPKKAELLDNINQSSFKRIGERAYRQLVMAEKKMVLIRKILKKKFQETELTYGRYLSVCESLFEAIKDNVEHLSESLKLGHGEGDLAAIELNIQELEKVLASPRHNEGHERQLESLQTRKKTIEDTAKELENTLADNEQAITALTKMAHDLSKLGKNKELGDVVEQLEALGSRLSKYEKTY